MRKIALAAGLLVAAARHLDAPRFRDFLAGDAARLKVAVEKIDRVDEK